MKKNKLKLFMTALLIAVTTITTSGILTPPSNGTGTDTPIHTNGEEPPTW
jgi:hypothetical protein